VSLDSKIKYVLEASEDAKDQLDSMYHKHMITMDDYVDILDQVLNQTASMIQKLRTNNDRRN